jgi:hypothetical protein
MFTHRLRGALAAALILLSTGLAAVLPAGASAHRSHRHPARHRAHHARHNSIPQHNGGDRDADNNGGPSDGDGNI